MDKRLKFLMEAVEGGDENAASDIAKEFPDQFEKIFGIPMPKLVKKRDGGIIDKEELVTPTNKKPRGKPQGVGKAIKGYGRAYMS